MKQKQIELDPLTARRHEIIRALAQDKRTPGGTLTAEARRWLAMEKRHYEASPANDLDTWAAARGRIEAIEAQTAAAVAEREAAAEQAKADAAAKAQEVDDKIRAKILDEVAPDPVTAYKRAHSTRVW